MEFTGFKAEIFIAKTGDNSANSVAYGIRWSNTNELDTGWSLKPYFELALKVASIALADTSCDTPFFWANGRVTWSLTEVNAILAHIGLINFLHTLSNNTGGARWKYAISTLDAVLASKRGTDEYCVPYPEKQTLQDALDLGINFSFNSHPPLQEAGEEYFVTYTAKDGILHEACTYYEDIED